MNVVLCHVRKSRAAARAAVVVGLLLLAGCDEGTTYPTDLVYPARTDPIVPGAVQGKDADGFDPPGQLEQHLGSLDSKLGVKAVVPAGLPADRRQTLRDELDQLFGTPANPKLALPGADALKQLLGLDDVAGADAHLAEGSRLYRRHCLHCHGLAGDGRGPTAPWVNPHPRDYRKGVFKFTSSGQSEGVRKPLRADLLRTLRQGIEGTSMPTFALLPDAELDAMASYVIHLSLRGEVEAYRLENLSESEALGTADALAVFAGRWSEAAAKQVKPPQPAELKDDELKASITRGYAIFVDPKGAGSCISCHRDFGRGQRYLYDVWGTVVRPANLTAGVYRGGRRPIDLFWRVRTGINGAGMPASVETNLDDANVWHLVNFLRALPYPQMLPADIRKQIYDDKTTAHAGGH